VVIAGDHVPRARDVRNWPNADVETRLHIRQLGEVKRTCRVHVQLVRL